MFLTDGMTERDDVDFEALLEAGAEMHPREAVQHLVHAVLEATGGTLKTTPRSCASTGMAARRAID